MTDTMYDALEVCLQALERGASLESCLARFPALADELRPILETAVQARAQAIRDVPAEAMRRGRARVLQHAAELCERNQAIVVPFWRKPWQAGRAFRLLATSLTAVVFLFSGGTGLVFASSNSLPGDNLYPVKRSWEDVQLAFIFDPKAKSEREMEFEHERVHEIQGLFSESRKTRVDFQGVVDSQQADVWQVSGLRIAIDDDVAPDSKIVPGALVQVIGGTEDGIIQAEQIILIQAPSATQTPTLQPSPTSTLQPTNRLTETSETGETVEPGETQSSSDVESPKPENTDSHENEPTQQPKPSDKPNSDGGGDSGGGGEDN
jgi:hypothetical protein